MPNPQWLHTEAVCGSDLGERVLGPKPSLLLGLGCVAYLLCHARLFLQAVRLLCASQGPPRLPLLATTSSCTAPCAACSCLWVAIRGALQGTPHITCST